MRDLNTIHRMHEKLPRPPAVEPVLELVKGAEGHPAQVEQEQPVQMESKERRALIEIQQRLNQRAIITSGEVFAIKDIVNEALK